MNVWVYDPKVEKYQQVNSSGLVRPEYLVPSAGGGTTGAWFLTRIQRTPLRSFASEPPQVRLEPLRVGPDIYTTGTPLLVIDEEPYLYYLYQMSPWSLRRARLTAWLRCLWAMLRSAVHRRTTHRTACATSSAAEMSSLSATEIRTVLANAGWRRHTYHSRRPADRSSSACPPKDSKTCGNGIRQKNSFNPTWP